MFIVLLASLLFMHTSIQANMIADMALMLGGQMGASMADQSISAMYANMGNAIATDQNNLMNSNQDFQSYVKKASKEELKNIFKFFKAAQKHMGNLTTEQTAFVNQMEAYIEQAISLNPPQSDYIGNNGPRADQQFTLGTMYTPQGQIWKNVFPVGNWEYDETTDSFWQMSSGPFLVSETDPTTQAVSMSAEKAPNNSIFTEWTTRQSSYEISCQITLYQVMYPFFVGILFNKARWISGDTNRLQKYRLLGIYGNANNKIQISFAEQYTPQPTATAGNPTPLYPFQQIINTSSSSSEQNKIKQNAFTTLSLQPITFNIKIISSPTTVQYKVWQSTATEPDNFITLQSKDKNLFLYHGIGFMAPGAIAQFKILKPTEILFSPAARKTFTAEVRTLHTKGTAS